MEEDVPTSNASLETIIVAGLEDGAANELAMRVGVLVSQLRVVDPTKPLDLKRMRRMGFSTNYGNDLEQLLGNAGRNSWHTQEEYAVGVAKVHVLRLEDGGLEIVPVFDANIFAILGQDYETLDEERKAWFGRILHMLHHELCHVHDDNKKIDAMPASMLGKVWSAAEMYTGSLAETAWSEYFANRASSITASDIVISETAEMFKDAVQRTKPAINGHVLEYRTSADLEALMALFQRHGDFLVKAAAYMLGYLDGLEKTLEQVSEEAHRALVESDFLPIWQRMRDELKRMFDRHPAGWDDSLAIYAQLSEVMQDFYDDMGLVLESQPDGSLYVDIPFRPNNSTTEMIRWASLSRGSH